jgi:hypothetical protein
MHNIAVRSNVARTVIVAAIALAVPVAIGAQLRADDETTKPVAEPSKLAQDLIGTWILCGTPDDEQEPPASGGRLKFFTGKHWTVIELDDSHAVVGNHGGAYALNGDEYVETIKYATENRATLIGQSFKFKITVEGDKFTQVGVGNPYSEVRRRAK